MLFAPPEVYQDKFKRAVVLVEADEDEGSAGDQEVAVAEWTRGATPVSCKWVKPQGPPRGFDFDVTKADQIFDLLLKEKQLKRRRDGRWRVAIDFRDLNRATPKDEYPMPVAETLINAAAGHKVLSFMDGNAGYNQIFMAPEDIHKTAFRVPGSVGLFEYVVMTFGLKNAGATYQRAMNYIFHDLIGKLVEIYIDDVVVKSVSMEGHLDDLRRILDRTGSSD
ncbi:hypothetical protein QYE76_062730 [Lolium multiflorum]|uniref:Reverse transcriptase domain-containing protein n=1 Tax=Lolium multiflorum TaxID=4521 RepID=A0AAD8S5R6_LOLMU|nr:hypothetical protein QYE76_062730 [Lolium multiflorum]